MFNLKNKKEHLLKSKDMLQFFTNEGDAVEGISDSGIATFMNAPYAHVARECGQNSADACKEKPVRIEFEKYDVDAEEFPAIEDYKSTISICLKRAEDDNDEKAISFFKRAKEVVYGEKIQILKISDFNTTGLIGPSVRDTAFHSLLKGSGVSRKDTNTSGGSFGIGKNATFAVSELQTVFYSTLYCDENSGEDLFLAQGKSVLISHENADGQPKRSIGYWGNENFQPIDSMQDVPDWLKREEVGTSINAIGFKASPTWQYQMAASILSNFFHAILMEEMEFYIKDGQILISKDTISDVFKDHKIRHAADLNNQLEALDFAENLYRCLVSEDTVEDILQIDDLGDVSVKVLVDDGLDKRVAIIRNGMLITDNLKHFGDSFRRFAMYKDFIAVVEPKNKKGNALIRQLENPSHDDLSAEWITDKATKRQAIRAMRELKDGIREAIKSKTFTEPEDETELDEMNEFFSESYDSDKIPDPEAETNPEIIEYSPPARKKKKKSPPEPEIIPGEYGDDVGPTPEPNPDPSPPKPNPIPGPGPGSEPGNRGLSSPTEFFDVRNVYASNDNKHCREIFFTPTDTNHTAVKIMAAGLDANDNLQIIDADEGEIKNGRIGQPPFFNPVSGS